MKHIKFKSLSQHSPSDLQNMHQNKERSQQGKLTSYEEKCHDASEDQYHRVLLDHLGGTVPLTTVVVVATRRRRWCYRSTKQQQFAIVVQKKWRWKLGVACRERERHRRVSSQRAPSKPVPLQSHSVVASCKTEVDMTPLTRHRSFRRDRA